MEASASSINLMVSGIDRNSSETVPGAMSRIYGNSLRFRDVSVRSASPVGRIYKAVSHAPREAPWFWGLEFHEWQGSDGPQYGQVATLEAEAAKPRCVGS